MQCRCKHLLSISRRMCEKIKTAHIARDSRLTVNSTPNLGLIYFDSQSFRMWESQQSVSCSDGYPGICRSVQCQCPSKHLLSICWRMCVRQHTRRTLLEIFKAQCEHEFYLEACSHLMFRSFRMWKIMSSSI